MPQRYRLPNNSSISLLILNNLDDFRGSHRQATLPPLLPDGLPPLCPPISSSSAPTRASLLVELELLRNGHMDVTRNLTLHLIVFPLRCMPSLIFVILLPFTLSPLCSEIYEKHLKTLNSNPALDAPLDVPSVVVQRADPSNIPHRLDIFTLFHLHSQ